jgi:hypothetical protein
LLLLRELKCEESVWEDRGADPDIFVLSMPIPIAYSPSLSGSVRRGRRLPSDCVSARDCACACTSTGETESETEAGAVGPGPDPDRRWVAFAEGEEPTDSGRTGSPSNDKDDVADKEGDGGVRPSVYVSVFAPKEATNAPGALAGRPAEPGCVR